MKQCTLNITLFAKLNVRQIYCVYNRSHRNNKLLYSRKVWRGGKFDDFGELSVIHQTKTIRLVLTINNLLADLLIHQTFFCQRLKKSQFTKLSPAKLSCYIV